LDPNGRDDYAARVRSEYEQVRRDRGERRDKEQRHPIAEARRRRFAIDWSSVEAPAPSFVGVRSWDAFPLEDLVDRIDWSPFFATWELSGRYPAILDDPTVGQSAQELHRDALALLDRIISDRLLTARGAVG